MCSISNIGRWIREFNQRLYRYQERNMIDWQFKGWVIEFQGEREDNAEKSYWNRGFPHPHLIFAGNWLGKIQDIQNLWPYGRVDLTTAKDISRKKPWLNDAGGLRLANYLTKYVSKSSATITEKGVHKGYAWLAFSGGRVFSIKHEKKKNKE